MLLRNSNLQSEAKPTVNEIARASKAFHEFILCGNAYKPERVFKGNVCLVKASKLRKRALTLPSDYGISACISGKVSVHVVDGTHENFVLKQGAIECAKIIHPLIA